MMPSHYKDTESLADKEPLMKESAEPSTSPSFSRSSTWTPSTPSVSDVEASAVLTSRQAARARVWRMVDCLRWIIETALLLGILVLVVQKPAGVSVATAGVGSDVTGFSPAFSTNIVRFGRELKYVPENLDDFFTKTVKQSWLSLVPQGLGFVRINDDEKSKYNNLPHPLTEYNNTVYTTSVTHQIHCLYAILDSYARAKTGREEGDHEWHIVHCFDYLRQSLMCAGDMALEGAQTSFPKEFQMGSDGFDSLHVCKNYNQVKSFLEDRRTDDKIWI